MPSLEPNRVELFSIPEITGVLAELDVIDAEARQFVIEALKTRAAERYEENDQEVFHGKIIDFAASYHRANAPEASDSNIEGWISGLREEAVEVLEFSVDRELTETEVIARDTAAATYVFMHTEMPFEDDVDERFLQNAGVNTSALFYGFKNGIIQVYSEATNQPFTVESNRISPHLNNFEDLKKFIKPEYSNRGFWKKIVAPLAINLRATLLREGFVLPELDADGLYPEEREDEDFFNEED